MVIISSTYLFKIYFLTIAREVEMPILIEEFYHTIIVHNISSSKYAWWPDGMSILAVYTRYLFSVLNLVTFPITEPGHFLGFPCR